MPELGIIPERRKNLAQKEDYARLFRKFQRYDIPKQIPALEKIRDWVESGSVVALTCYEKSPDQCHRRIVSDALERKFGPSFSATHL